MMIFLYYKLMKYAFLSDDDYYYSKSCLGELFQKFSEACKWLKSYKRVCLEVSIDCKGNTFVMPIFSWKDILWCLFWLKHSLSRVSQPVIISYLTSFKKKIKNPCNNLSIAIVFFLGDKVKTKLNYNVHLLFIFSIILFCFLACMSGKASI